MRDVTHRFLRLTAVFRGNDTCLVENFVIFVIGADSYLLLVGTVVTATIAALALHHGYDVPLREYLSARRVGSKFSDAKRAFLIWNNRAASYRIASWLSSSRQPAWSLAACPGRGRGRSQRQCFVLRPDRKPLEHRFNVRRDLYRKRTGQRTQLSNPARLADRSWGCPGSASGQLGSCIVGMSAIKTVQSGSDPKQCQETKGSDQATLSVASNVDHN